MPPKLSCDISLLQKINDWCHTSFAGCARLQASQNMVVDASHRATMCGCRDAAVVLPLPLPLSWHILAVAMAMTLAVLAATVAVVVAVVLAMFSWTWLCPPWPWL